MDDSGSFDPASPQRLVDGLPSAAHRRSRRLAWIYTGAAVALLPWIVYLAVTLPRRDLDLHYRAAWVGFDLFLAFAIVRTAYMAFRVDPRIQFPATATATLLLVDAWFDITTAGSRSAMLEALVLAAVFEIPAALFSIHLAHDVGRRLIEQAALKAAGYNVRGPAHRFRRRSAPTEPNEQDDGKGSASS